MCIQYNTKRKLFQQKNLKLLLFMFAGAIIAAYRENAKGE